MIIRCSQFVGLLVYGALSLVMPGTANAQSPCTQLVAVDQERNLISWAIYEMQKLFEAKEEVASQTGIGDSKYWFTKSPGRFVGLNCGDTPFERQEIYTIGTVVKPISVLDIPSYQKGTPILVLTEHGHRKVVPLEDIEPIALNTRYIFADSHGIANMCREVDNCLGHSVEKCGGDNCRHDITAYFGYATTPSQNEHSHKAIGAYREIRQDALIMNNVIWDENDVEELKDEACTPFPVTAWGEGGVRHQTRSLFFSFCYDIGKKELSGFKVVDQQWAKDRFETSLWGSFHRNFGDVDSLFSKEAQELLKVNIVSKKACGVEIKTENAATIGGGLGIGFSANDETFLELSANRKAVSTFTETVPSDVYLLYSTYFVRPIVIEGEAPPDKDVWVFDFVFRAKCDEAGNAKSASSITVFYDKLPGGFETIDASKHLEQRYFDGHKNDAFSRSRSIAEIESGRFWFVSDHISYFKWRDTLREFMIEGMPEVADLLEKYPLSQRPLIRDFFVHLVMSAAFDYKEPPRKKRRSRL